jgi:hypothetical protein
MTIGFGERPIKRDGFITYGRGNNASGKARQIIVIFQLHMSSQPPHVKIAEIVVLTANRY